MLVTHLIVTSIFCLVTLFQAESAGRYLRNRSVGQAHGRSESDVAFQAGNCGLGAGSCSRGLCCSASGFCGSTTAYCGIGCQASYGQCASTPTSPPTLAVAPNGRCGKGYGSCGTGNCCSSAGYCGNTAAYCGVGCQAAYGMCGSVSPSTSPTAKPTTAAPSTTVTPTAAPSTKPTAVPSTVASNAKPTAVPTTVAPSAKPTAVPSTVAPSTGLATASPTLQTPEYWYKFDSVDVTSSSVSSYGAVPSSGTLVGSATIDTSNVHQGTGSLRTSSSGYMQLDAIDVGSVGFTVSIWFYVNATTFPTSPFVLLSNFLVDEPQFELSIGYDSTTQRNQISPIINFASVVPTYFPTPPSVKTWYHVAVTVDTKAIVSIYLNGGLLNSGKSAYGYPIPPLCVFTSLGTEYKGGTVVNNSLTGNLDDFRLYQKVLTAKEITILYKS